MTIKNFFYVMSLGSTFANTDLGFRVWIGNQLDVTYVLSFISPLQVTQHVSGNHVPIFSS
jgi:hypothetical protein